MPKSRDFVPIFFDKLSVLISPVFLDIHLVQRLHLAMLFFRTGLTLRRLMSNELLSVTPLLLFLSRFISMKTKESPSWLKNRGYLHITRQIDVNDPSQKVLSKVCNKNYVAKYAFFPLIHASIDERRYKQKPAAKKQSLDLLDAKKL